MTIASSVIGSFVDPLQVYINEGAASVAAAVEGPLRVGAMLYIVIFGIMILLGYVKSPVSDFVINVIKIAIIVFIVSQVDAYNAYVSDLFFVQIPEGLGSAVGGMTGSSLSADAIRSGTAFDEIIDRSIRLGEQISEEGSWRDMWPYLVAGAYTIISLIVTMVILAIYLFVALLLFRSTQPFFSSWLAAVVNFVLLQVMTVALVGMMISMISDFVARAEGAGFEALVHANRLFGLFALALYLGLQLPSIAARISGGGLALGGGIAQAVIRAAMRVPGAGTAAARGGSITPNR